MQEMGYKLDKSHAYFKERALRELSEQQLAGDLVEKEDLAIPEEAGSSQVSHSLAVSMQFVILLSMLHWHMSVNSM